MSDKPTSKRRIGRALLAAGIALTLLCHLLGSWDLIRFNGRWLEVQSEGLGYDIPCFDMHPGGPEAGRVVIYPGFSGSVQIYFPLAITLLHSGYAVRIVAHSGTSKSKVRMSYQSHALESLEAARAYFADRPDLPHFLAGHSEGTRFALKTARELSGVDGVLLFSTISAEMNAKEPSNVLILVAENDFNNIMRQSRVALMNGTKLARPEGDRTYGSFKQGTARRAQIISEANHLTIVFDEASHRAALDWLKEISGGPSGSMRISSRVKYPVLAVGAVLGALLAVGGIGVLFRRSAPTDEKKSISDLAFVLLVGVGWLLAAFVGASGLGAAKIPLLVYGRILVFFAVAGAPLLLLAIARPKLGAGMPSGSWAARATLLALTLTLFLFDRWLMGVMPLGARLFWFAVASVVSGAYFACEEFWRRGVQRATDWQTGFALGLIGSLFAALSVAGASFSIGPVVGQYLVVGSVTLFVLMALCEIPATYLYTMTGDWLLSWFVRVSIFNGFLAGLVPLVSEAEFRDMILR
jgi:hypothetical protein